MQAKTKTKSRVLQGLFLLLLLIVTGGGWWVVSSPGDGSPPVEEDDTGAQVERDTSARTGGVRRSRRRLGDDGGGTATPTTEARPGAGASPVPASGAPSVAPDAGAAADPPAAQDPGVVSADPGTGDVAIFVRDDAGVGLPGMEVLVHSHVDGKIQQSHALVTDPSGRCQALGLAPGGAAASTSVGSLTRTAPFQVVAGRMQEVSIRLGQGATVEGVVRHVERGPLAGVTLSIGTVMQSGTPPETQRDSLTAITDEKGRYRLERVPPGVHDVAIKGESIGYHPRPRGTLEVRSEALVIRDFMLGDVSLEGVVREAGSGTPLSSVRVQIQKPLYVDTTTDARGEYRFLDLPDGDYPMAITHEGHELKFVRSGAVTMGTPRRLDIELRPAAALAIHVVDGAGAPVQGDLTLTIMVRAPGATAAVGTGIRTDSDGRARYTRIVPGDYTLIVNAPGFEAGRVETAVAAGETAVEFVVRSKGEAAKGAVSLRGTVTDASTGAPIQGVRVSVQGGSWQAVYTDRKGIYQLRGLEPGAHQLVLSKDAYGLRFAKDARVPKGEPGVLDQTLQPAATLRMRILDQHGVPVVGRVTLAISPQTRDAGLTHGGTGVEADTNGVALYHQIVPGKYKLRIVVSGKGSAGVETDVVHGENVLDFQLE